MVETSARCHGSDGELPLPLWERVGVRGHGLSIGLNPSPGSHLTMRHSRSYASAFFLRTAAKGGLCLSHKGRGEDHSALAPVFDPDSIFKQPNIVIASAAKQSRTVVVWSACRAVNPLRLKHLVRCFGNGGALPLPLWERVGVRGHGLSLGRNPSPGSSRRCRADPTSPHGRGERARVVAG